MSERPSAARAGAGDPLPSGGGLSPGAHAPHRRLAAGPPPSRRNDRLPRASGTVLGQDRNRVHPAWPDSFLVVGGGAERRDSSRGTGPPERLEKARRPLGFGPRDPVPRNRNPSRRRLRAPLRISPGDADRVDRGPFREDAGGGREDGLDSLRSPWRRLSSFHDHLGHPRRRRSGAEDSGKGESAAHQGISGTGSIFREGRVRPAG